MRLMLLLAAALALSTPRGDVWAQQATDIQALQQQWQRTGEVQTQQVCRGVVRLQRRIHQHQFRITGPNPQNFFMSFISETSYHLCEHGNCRITCNLDCTVTFGDTSLTRVLEMEGPAGRIVVETKGWLIFGGSSSREDMNCNEAVNRV